MSSKPQLLVFQYQDTYSDQIFNFKKQINLILKSTSLSLVQISIWHNSFLVTKKYLLTKKIVIIIIFNKKKNDCPNGKLTINRKDLVKVYAKLFPHGNSEKFCDLLFRSIDLDHSRDLDFTEFLIALSFASEKDMNQKLRMIFHLIDIDKDGRIKKKEITRVINSIGELLDKKNDQKSQTVLKVNTFFRLIELQDANFMTEEEFIEANLKDPFIINFVYMFN